MVACRGRLARRACAHPRTALSRRGCRRHVRHRHVRCWPPDAPTARYVRARARVRSSCPCRAPARWPLARPRNPPRPGTRRGGPLGDARIDDRLSRWFRNLRATRGSRLQHDGRTACGRRARMGRARRSPETRYVVVEPRLLELVPPVRSPLGGNCFAGLRLRVRETESRSDTSHRGRLRNRARLAPSCWARLTG
jgi:hypothetical protein